MNHVASAAAQSIAIFGKIACITLRLTFGGSPNTPTWCLFSEIVTNLANEISLCEEWDSEVLPSPAQPVTPIPIMEPNDVPIGTACETAVRVPVGSTARTDGFTDNLITVTLSTRSGTTLGSPIRYRWPFMLQVAPILEVTNPSHIEASYPIYCRRKTG
jgi:hypothetical protein